MNGRDIIVWYIISLPVLNLHILAFFKNSNSVRIYISFIKYSTTENVIDYTSRSTDITQFSFHSKYAEIISHKHMYVCVYFHKEACIQLRHARKKCNNINVV